MAEMWAPLSATPERIGRYRSLEQIGAGATATVYRGTDGHREVALKVLHPFLAADPVVVERFRREVEVAQRLDHPGIVRIFDLAVWGEQPAIVMEYCPGGNLHRFRASSPEDIFTIAWQVGTALQAAHRVGVIHRDLKPQNLLRDAQGLLKLCDFGSARLQSLVGLTTSSMFIGTPQFVPPETLLGVPADPRTDMYGLGALLYQVTTGRSHLQESLPGNGARRELVPPSALRAGLPEWLDTLICRLLGPLAGRPPTATALLAWLHAGEVPEEPRHKRCLFCGAAMPAENALCLACGRPELDLRPPTGAKAWRIQLRRIKEEAATLQRFAEILGAISGQDDVPLDFMFGDLRFYSKEERKRLQKLPVWIVSELRRETAEQLKKLFDAIGATTRIRRHYMGTAPVETLVCVPRSSPCPPGATALLERAAAGLAAVEEGELKALLGGTFQSAHDLLRNHLHWSPDRDLLPRLEPLLARAQEATRRLAALDRLISAVEPGAVYAEVVRLTRRIDRAQRVEEIDRLIERKVQQLDQLERMHRLEQQRTELVTQLLSVQARLSELAARLATTKRSSGRGRPSGPEVEAAIAELEAELRVADRLKQCE